MAVTVSPSRTQHLASRVQPFPKAESRLVLVLASSRAYRVSVLPGGVTSVTRECYQ